MQLSSHNFVVPRFSDDPTVSEVLRSRSPYRSLQSIQSGTSDVDTVVRSIDRRSPSVMSISCRRRPPLMTTASRIFIFIFIFQYKRQLCYRVISRCVPVTSLWMQRTSCRFPVIFARTRSSRSQYFISTSHLSCGFLSQPFTEGLLQKPPWSAISAVTSYATV